MPKLATARARRSFAHFLQYASEAETPSDGLQGRPQLRQRGRLTARFEGLRLIGSPRPCWPRCEQNVNHRWKNVNRPTWAALATVLLLAACTPAAAADTFSGIARAMDGDSLMVGEREVRLFGIDAPEWGQNLHEERPAVGVRRSRSRPAF